MVKHVIENDAFLERLPAPSSISNEVTIAAGRSGPLVPPPTALLLSHRLPTIPELFRLPYTPAASNKPMFGFEYIVKPGLAPDVILTHVFNLETSTGFPFLSFNLL